MAINDPTVIDRFWSMVSVADTQDCWEWTGHLDEKGYGRIKYGGKKGRAIRSHRLSAMIHQLRCPDETSFQIESKWLVLHKCNNRKCVNPTHLYIGNQKSNVKDALIAQTHNCLKKGSTHHCSKLSDKEREEIVAFRRNGVILRVIADTYDISESSVSRIFYNAQD